MSAVIVPFKSQKQRPLKADLEAAQRRKEHFAHGHRAIASYAGKLFARLPAPLRTAYLDLVNGHLDTGAVPMDVDEAFNMIRDAAEVADADADEKGGA